MSHHAYKPLIRMLVYSILFTFLLIAVRVVVTQSLDYANYYWNTLLAALPVLFASLLQWKKWKLLISIFFFGCWLVFLPNAPYLVTDLVHFEIIKSFPVWVDIILVTSASWNGLVLGILSMRMMEMFLNEKLRKPVVSIVIFTCIILTGYGIYLGRFLRYNSWDIVTNPFSLARDIFESLIFPMQHTRTWGFTILFGMMFSIFYFTLKQMPGIKDRG